MDTKFEDINKQIDNMVVLYTSDSNSIKNLYDINTNVLIFTDDTSIGKLYRGGGKGKELQLIGTETANRLSTPVNIYGNTFDGTQDISTNLTMNGTLDNSLGNGLFDSISVRVMNILENITTNTLNTNNINTNDIFIESGIVKFKKNGANVSLNLAEGIGEIESIVVTKIFNDVESLFNSSYNEDSVGTTYIVKKGNSDNNTSETFVLSENENGEKELIPTSSYIISTNEPNKEFNYQKGNIIWIDKLYNSNNKEDIDINNGSIIDDTVITSENYRELYNAIQKLYYIIGVDMDAGNVEESNNNEGEGIDGGEFDSNTETTKSNYGLILTDLNYNQKTTFSNFETEEKPDWLAELDEPIEGEEDEDAIDEDYDVILPDELSGEITSLGEHFVKAIRIKRGKYSDMMDVSNCLLDGELIWCKYDVNYPTQSNKLFIKSTDKFNNPQFYCINVGNNEEDNEEDNYLTELVDIEKVDWLTDNLTKYRMDVNNQGKITVSPICKNQSSMESYYNSGKNRYKIYINSLYCGGLNSNKTMFRPCSHNFIELSNLTNYDINLEEANISLQYIDRSKYNATTDKLYWEILPLTGTIKAGGTYLIRGAECAPINCNTTRLKIETYDQEWYDSNGNLISFDVENPSFVLYMGKRDINGELYSCTNDIGDLYKNGLGAKYCFDGTDKRNFLNTIGIQNYQSQTEPLYYENTPVKMSNYNLLSNNVLYIQYFTMDAVNQAITDGLKRNNNTDTYVINLAKNYQEGIDKYYSGKASFENKNLFYNKTDLGELPNMVMCTFGKQATDNGNGATRCFNWLSVGYYNEYIKLTYPNGNVKYFESFKNINQDIYTGQKEITFTISDNHYNDTNSRFSYKNIYDRYRTFTTSGIPFTVHKLIIDGLTEGVYKYQVGKEEGWSEEYTFEVLSDNTINRLFDNGEYITFMHHSDQQGFNKDEYKAWEYIVEYVMCESKKTNGIFSKPIFSINTGDVTQNGNRINEWLDYYECGKKLFKYSECMHTVGNNDLSPVDNTILGDGGDDSKINPKNFDIFFCHDLSIEEQDLLTVKLKNETYRLVPSNYSFDYANCHFICINSELPKTAIMKLFNENADEYAFANKNDIPNYDTLMEEYSIALAEKIENWLDNDCVSVTTYNNSVDKINQKWIIAYCHEMPFTILTHAITLKHQADRLNVKGASIAGCRLNGIKSHNKYYWLSRLFEKYHIPLVLGGHKHTYSMSARIKENIIINDNGTEDYSQTYRPIIQLKRSELENVYGKGYTDSELRNLWYNTGKKKNNEKDYPTVFEDNICDVDDIEIIDDVNKGEDYSAPMYSMQTAAGYKLISNKELPAVVIPWLTVPAGNAMDNRLDNTYFPATAKPKVNDNQLYPYFTIYKFNKEEIIGTPIRMSQTVNAQTKEIYYKGNTKAKGTYDLINKTYNESDIEKWMPDITNGMVANLEIKVTNKPY